MSDEPKSDYPSFATMIRPVGPRNFVNTSTFAYPDFCGPYTSSSGHDFSSGHIRRGYFTTTAMTSTSPSMANGDDLYGIVQMQYQESVETARQRRLAMQLAQQNVSQQDIPSMVHAITSTGGIGGSGSVGWIVGYGPYSNSQSSAVPMIRTAASADLDTVSELTTDMVDNYGGAEMQRSATLSDKLLSLIGQDNAGEFSDKLNNLVLIAKGLDPEEASKQRSIWRRLLNFLGVKSETAAAHYRMLDTQISTLAGELKVHSDRQGRRRANLEGLYLENSRSYDEIGALVAKGRAFLAKAQESPVASVKTGMEAQAIADRQALSQRLHKRVTDLDVAMTLMLQTAPEIRIMQANAQALIDKFTTLTSLTIPAWKKQFALHVLQLEQKRSAGVADAVDDATNDAFRKNADMLYDNTLQVAKSGQRQIMDMSTVEHVQGEIIRTVQDVRQLNAESAANRTQIAAKLEHIRDDLVASVAGTYVARIEGPTTPEMKQVEK